jgi:hypothetical protein
VKPSGKRFASVANRVELCRPVRHTWAHPLLRPRELAQGRTDPPAPKPQQPNLSKSLVACEGSLTPGLTCAERPPVRTYNGLLPSKVQQCRARALWGLTRNLRKPRNTAKCLPTPSLHFCYPGATGLRFRPGRQPAVESAAPLSRHNPHDARDSGSSLGSAPRSEFALQRQPFRHQCRSRQAPSEHARPVLGQRTMEFSS